MANITPRIVEGKIVSYRIRVHRGRDKDKKQLKPYSMTFYVPEKLQDKPEKAKKEAEKAAAIFEAECKKGNISAEHKRFEEYAEYVMTLKDRDKKHRTVHSYRSLLVRINEEIGYLRLDAITYEHLNNLYFKLGQVGSNKKTGGARDPKTIREHHRLIHVIFAQAIKEGLLTRNVADMATPPSVPRRESKHSDVEDVKKLLNVLVKAPLKWRCISNLLIATGARRGEIMGLEWQDIDFKSSKITIRNNLLYTPEKGVYISTPKSGETRTVTIPDSVVRLLVLYKAEYDDLKEGFGDDWYSDMNFCFVADYGRRMHPDSITHWLKKFTKKNELNHVSPHMLRHTQASILINQNVDIVTISKRLGHASPTTTQKIYAHEIKNSDKKANDKISEMFYAENNEVQVKGLVVKKLTFSN